MYLSISISLIQGARNIEEGGNKAWSRKIVIDIIFNIFDVLNDLYVDIFFTQRICFFFYYTDLLENAKKFKISKLKICHERCCF